LGVARADACGSLTSAHTLTIDNSVYILDIKVKISFMMNESNVVKGVPPAVTAKK